VYHGGTGVAHRASMRTQCVALGVVLGLVVLAVSPATAGPPTDQLKQRVDQVIKVLDDPALRDKPTERQAAIRKIAEDVFDYPDAARRALGVHWNTRTPQEREEFARLFADVLDRAYVSKIDLYQGEKVSYPGETIDGDQATVKTRIVTKKGSEVPVDYRMHLQSGRWLVYDVIIESVSLVANYRNQFNKIVQTESYQALVDRLRSKEATPAASPRESPRSQ
jgi:phospholipid transport system substrate-binding protein